MKLRESFPVQLLCDLVGLPRSSFYYDAHPRDDTTLQAQIRAVMGEWPTYGVPRVTAQIKRAFEVTVNHKRVARVMGAMGLTQKKRRKKHHTTHSAHPFPRFPNLVRDVIAQHPEHIWVADITYIQLAQDEVYLAILMDVFTRAIRG